jgi:excisionase family DNA binding protein
VPKLIRRGELTPRGATDRKLPSLARDQVLELAERRARPRRAPTRPKHRVDHRPDPAVYGNRDWLSPAQVAQLLGITKQAVTGRIRRGRLPAVECGGRWWIRRDHLEQIEAAWLVTKTRQP